jgi:hypothetical protein
MSIFSGSSEAAAARRRKAAKVKKKEKKAAEKEKQDIEQQSKQDESRFQENLGEAQGYAGEDINQYFTNRGLDPGAYQSDIDRAIQQATLGVPDLAENIPGYFSGIADNLYSELESGARTRALSGLDSLLPQGFEQNLIPSTADDAIIQEILGTSRGEADKYVQNLFDRGVVTNAGFQAAQGDVTAQEAKVRALLNQLGGQVLGEGQARLGGIANEGRMAASNLNLGQAFDPNTYKTRIDQAFNEITAGLPDALKALIPEKGLFQTSGLAARAGAGQGAQNTVFSPNALAGVYEPEEENRKAAPLSIF